MRGDHRAEIGGVSMTMRFSTNVLCNLEDQHGVTVGAAVMALGSGDSMATFRHVMLAGLRTHHPALTLADVGDMIDEMGPLKARKLVTEAFNAAFPPETGDGGNPPAAAGTGIAS